MCIFGTTRNLYAIILYCHPYPLPKSLLASFLLMFKGYSDTVYRSVGSHGPWGSHTGPSDDSNNFTHELRGIIPRSFEYLFSLINREKQKVTDKIFCLQ